MAQYNLDTSAACIRAQPRFGLSLATSLLSSDRVRAHPGSHGGLHHDARLGRRRPPLALAPARALVLVEAPANFRARSRLARSAGQAQEAHQEAASEAEADRRRSGRAGRRVGPRGRRDDREGRCRRRKDGQGLRLRRVRRRVRRQGAQQRLGACRASWNSRARRANAVVASSGLGRGLHPEASQRYGASRFPRLYPLHCAV